MRSRATEHFRSLSPAVAMVLVLALAAHIACSAPQGNAELGAAEGSEATSAAPFVSGATVALSGGSAAVYFSLTNPLARSLSLEAVAVLVGAQDASLHTTSMEGEVMRMRALPELAVPAGETVELAPGGVHVMLTGVSADASSLELALVFGDGTRLPLQIALPSPPR